MRWISEMVGRIKKKIKVGTKDGLVREGVGKLVTKKNIAIRSARMEICERSAPILNRSAPI